MLVHRLLVAEVIENNLAVRVGFEPTEPVKVQRFSRPPDSTALAPHRFRILPFPSNLDQLSLCRFLHRTGYCHYFVTTIRQKPNGASFCIAVRVSVSHRHADGRMPQQLFHRYKIGARLRQPRRERMPEGMDIKGLADAGVFFPAQAARGQEFASSDENRSVSDKWPTPRFQYKIILVPEEKVRGSVPKCLPQVFSI